MINLAERDVKLEEFLKLKTSRKICFRAQKRDVCQGCMYEKRKACKGDLQEYQIIENINKDAKFLFQIYIVWHCHKGYKMSIITWVGNSPATKKFIIDNFSERRERYF